MEEKIELILEIIEDLPLSKWKILKEVIDNKYREQEKTVKVPKEELGTFKDYLKFILE